MRRRQTSECACLFCGGRDGVEVVARDDGAAALAICAACRSKLAAAWAADGAAQPAAAQGYGDAAKQIMAEAAAMTEEDFEGKYLSDETDRVVFEYVRGYGQTELLGGAMGLLSIMTEKGAEEIRAHIDGLTEKGLIYPVAGKPGWYGADYPFADD